MTTETTATDAPRPALAPRRWLRWVVEAALAMGVYLAIAAWQERHLLGADSQAPAFALRALSGERVSLDDLRGKRVLLHFWATWCGVCRRELSALSAVHADLAPDEALVTVVADGDDVEHVRRFVEEEHIAYPVLLGTDPVVRAYRVNAYPTNYFIDPEGRIQGQTVGMSTRWSLAARLRWEAR